MSSMVHTKILLAVITPVFFITACMTGDDGDMMIELKRLEQEFAHAALRGDTAVAQRLLADDFIGIGPDGLRLSKTQVLDNLKLSRENIIDLRHENIHIAIFNGCAVATAQTVVEWTQAGVNLSGRYPYMRVWIRRSGRWLAVATQSGGRVR